MTTSISQANLQSLPRGVATPGYDRSTLRAGILHVGVGNFHRAHQAVYLHRLFEMSQDHDWALVGGGVRPADVAMRTRLSSQDWLYSVVELDPERLSAAVIGSIVDFVEVDPAALVERMTDPAIRIVSLTITEGGYFVDAKTGGFDVDHPDIRADIGAPLPRTVFGILAEALARRFDRGAPAFTVMSCDNLPGNGDAARSATLGVARERNPDLAARVEDEVAFPNGMVDCITPATTDARRAMIRETFDLDDAAPVVCEPFRQWVLEDRFPAGRPRLEDVGVEFVGDVVAYELMKLRILNGGHAAMAYPGALFGYTYAHEAMADPDIVAWLRALIAREVIPTLGPIAGVSYEAYLDQIVDRFANARVADTIARLCLDGSDRQPKFILPTIESALEAGRPIAGLALEVALWCRFCAGPDEQGRPTVIDDERAATLRERAITARTDPGAFLGLEEVFGSLGRTPAFAEVFSAALSRIYAGGTREVLRSFVAG
jgi:mannitol 2-dehydrogenase